MKLYFVDKQAVAARAAGNEISGACWISVKRIKFWSLPHLQKSCYVDYTVCKSLFHRTIDAWFAGKEPPRASTRHGFYSPSKDYWLGVIKYQKRHVVTIRNVGVLNEKRH